MKQFRKFAVLSAACIALTGMTAALPASVLTVSAAAVQEETFGDYTYETDGSSVTITKYNTDSAATEIEIPSELGGLPVTAIGANAFEKAENLEKIVVPEGVVSIESYAFTWCRALTSLKLPSTLKTIGSWAFYYCTALPEIVIPEGVTEMGDHALSGLSAAEKIQLPSTLKVMELELLGSDKMLTRLVIPEGVETMKEYVLQNCTALTEIVLPKSLKTIGYGVFTRAPKLTDVYYCGTEEEWNAIEIDFDNRYLTDATVHFEYVPEGQPGPDSGQTDGCELLYDKADDHILIGSYTGTPTDVVIPAEIEGLPVTEIGGSAFADCATLTSVSLPDTLTKINDYAFFGCSSLTEVTLPASVEELGFSAFGYCSSLETFTIYNPECYIYEWDGETICSGKDEDNENFIYEGVIKGYAGSTAQKYADTYGYTFQALEADPEPDDTVPDGLQYRVYSADGYVRITGYDNSAESLKIPAAIEGFPVTEIATTAFEDCDKLKQIVLPDTLTAVGTMTFKGCTNLEEMILPDSLTSIGMFAFDSCTALTSVRIPDGVTSIPSNAFASCTGLLSVELPDTLTEIGRGAFEYCESLKSIEIPSGVTVIGNSAFYGCKAMESANIPEGVTTIGVFTFWEAESLKEITIPESVTGLERGAFGYTKALKEITIPESVTSIGMEMLVNAGVEKITVLNPDCEIYSSEYTFGGKKDEKAAIYGYANSTAQAYAEEYDYPFVPLDAEPTEELDTGDPDGDGEISVTDAQITLQWAAEIMIGNEPEDMTPAQRAAVDIDGDGEITVTDAQLILNYYANVTLGGLDVTWDDIINGRY